MSAKQPPPRSPNYLGAVVALVGIGVAAVVWISVARPGDNTALVLQVVGFVATITTALLAFLKASETHTIVNSRLTAWIEAAQKTSRAEGVIEGRADGREASK